MKMARLLAVGKSMVGLKDSEGRYRLPNQKLLPDFGKNPFSEHKPETGGAGVGQEPAAKAELQPTASTAAPAQPEGPGLVGRCGEWVAGIFGLNKQRAAIPKFRRTPVQTELTLDQVRVVRNDLRDSDFDYVPVESKPRAGRGRPAKAASPGKASASAEAAPETPAAAAKTTVEPHEGELARNPN